MLAKKITDRLEELKKSVESSHQYFKDNITRYKDFSKFVYETALTQDDLDTLAELDKPNLEFNCLEAYTNRLLGEFVTHEPDISISAADGVPVQLLTDEFFKTAQVLESYIRESLTGRQSEATKMRIFKDMIVGGYSVGHVYTEYVNEMSFEQNIYFERAYDPTLCGFDPLAVLPHKGDGRYCYQIVPKTRAEFEKEFGKKASEKIKCARSVGQYNWSYQNSQNEEIILVCDYYEKQFKRKKIVKLTNGDTMLEEHYPQYVEIIRKSPLFIQPPEIVLSRWTDIQVIVRYRFCQTEVLDYVETDYEHLPLVFFDGNSATIYNNDVSKQMTKPFVYHAAGMQKLKNFAGQTVANEIENMKMTQWVASIESIPEKYLDGYQLPQKLNTLIYNEMLDGKPEVRLTPPREVQRTPTPTIVTETFLSADGIIQSILGSYDAQQGYIGQKDLSGKAIQMGALQSDATAKPYLAGFIIGLDRVANIFVSLIPKYYKTPRTLPILMANGKRKFAIVNSKNDDKSVDLNYDPRSLNVKIEVGVNSTMQKQIALDTIIALMQSSVTFAEFINTEGLEVLLENVDIRGIDELKEMGKRFMEMKKRQMEIQQQMQQAEAQKPQTEDKVINAQLMLEAAKLQQKQIEEANKMRMKQEELAAKLTVETAKVSIDEQRAFTEHMKAKAEIANNAEDRDIKRAEINAEIARNYTDVINDRAIELESKVSEGDLSTF